MVVLLKIISFSIWLVIMLALIRGSRQLYNSKSNRRQLVKVEDRGKDSLETPV